MDRELSDLVSLGSCELHTIHNSVKHGVNATEWNLKKLHSSMFKIFHKSTSRRQFWTTHFNFVVTDW